MSGQEKEGKRRNHHNDARGIAESEHQTFFRNIQNPDFENDLFSDRLKKCLHQKKKCRGGDDESQKCPKEFTIYFSGETEREDNDQQKSMWRPIPGTDESNHQ